MAARESVVSSSRHQLLFLKWLSSPHLSQAFIYLIQLSPQLLNLPDMYCTCHLLVSYLIYWLIDKEKGVGCITSSCVRSNSSTHAFLGCSRSSDCPLRSGGNVSRCRLISQRSGGCEQHLKHIHMPWRDCSPQLARGWCLDVRQPWLIFFFQRRDRRTKLSYWDTIILLGN